MAAGDILVGAHPGGAPSHRWSAENFREVIGLLRGRYGCKFVITGNRGEMKLCRAIAEALGPGVVNLAGKLNLAELGALIKRCRLYISNDTAPMHIAAIVGTPLVAIFGPGYFERFDPGNISDKTAVIYRKAPCAPCGRTECDSMECLRHITPEEVMSAATKFLEAKI